MSFGPTALFIDDAGTSSSPTPVSATVYFELPPGEAVYVQLLQKDAPIRFGLAGFNFSREEETNITSLTFDTLGQSFTLEATGGSSQLFVELVTTSSIESFGLVQGWTGSTPVLFQGRPLQTVPTIFNWSQIIV